MIYVLEIPHQRKPACWSAPTRDEVINVVREVSARSGADIDGYEAAIAYLVSDLHALRVYEPKNLSCPLQTDLK